MRGALPGLARLVAAAVAGAAVLIAVAPAATAATTGRAVTAVVAHAALASTDPVDGSVLSKAPRQVSATFDETVGISADSLTVYSPSGQRVDAGPTRHISGDEIAVSLRPGLGDGTYTAVWHVISADTHPVDGAFTFSVGAASATHVGAVLPPSDAIVSGLFAVVRWLEYLCFALLGGGVAFLIVCWPDGGSRKGVGRLVLVSSFGLFASTLLGLLLQGPYSQGAGLNQIFNPTLVRSTLHGSLGPASEVRELLTLLAAGVASFLRPRLPTATLRFRRAVGVVWALLMTAVAASWAVYDHASTGVQAPWGIPDDIVHLDAMALWIGGLAVLAGFALRAQGSHGVAAVARAVPRFSAIALGCVIALVASGVYQTWREVGSWGALADTTYGRLVVAKITGLILLIELGYLARRLIQRGLSLDALLAEHEAPSLAAAAATVAAGPRTAAALGGAGGDGAGAQAGPPPGAAWATVLRRLRRSVAAELGIAAAILAVTAVLVNTATGREAYAPTVSASQAFSTGGPGGSGIVHVDAAPARLGPNTIELSFTKANGQAFAPAQVTAALYFPARKLGPLPVTLIRTAPGQYRALGATVTFTGQWTLQVIVRSDAFDETSVTFPLGIH
ncbi:MAG TPA: FixH family protein [Trebonia sp.]|jgi:copper transport protein